MQPLQFPATRQVTIEEGLEFILRHFERTEPIWPRTIFTRAAGRQVVVNNVREALAWYKTSNLLDRRISAYPKYTVCL
jgi:hypothetical protein